MKYVLLAFLLLPFTSVHAEQVTPPTCEQVLPPDFSTLRSYLALRYNVHVTGLETIKAKGDKGILFLFNHPAFMDPVLVMSVLGDAFQPRPIMDIGQTRKKVIGRVVKSVGEKVHTILLPDAKLDGPYAQKRTIAKVAQLLNAGENVLLYPAGELQRDGRDHLRSNFMAEELLKAAPQARVVLGRTKGMWGSSFSYGSRARQPMAPQAMAANALSLAQGKWVPKRKVEMELIEPADFPRNGTRAQQNRFMEAYFNNFPNENIQVPRFLWSLKGTKVTPEQEAKDEQTPLVQVPDELRSQVYALLENVTGSGGFNDSTKLSEMGISSLNKATLHVQLEQKFKADIAEIELLQTVGDCLRAANGERIGVRKPRVPSRKWVQRKADKAPLELPPGETLTEMFLNQAEKYPNRIVIEDERSGALTYRDMLVRIQIMRNYILKNFKDEPHIGVMLPSSGANLILYWAILFAGKVPVQPNFTASTSDLAPMVELGDVNKILTSSEFVYQRLPLKEITVEPIDEKTVSLELLASGITLLDKVKATVSAYTSAISELRQVPISPNDMAVLLYTGGSTKTPKAVPLKHKHLVAEMKGVLRLFKLQNDSIMGFLPAFHSFGNALQLMSVLTGTPTVYHPDPTDTRAIVEIIREYKTTVLLGTPLFLENIFSAAKPEDLKSLRLVVAGAQALPKQLNDKIIKVLDGVHPLEGYGATETGPVMTVNPPDFPVFGTVGVLIDGLEALIVDPETLEPLPRDQDGLLIVKGPSVFDGYYKQTPEQDPFVKVAGFEWYNTGDLGHFEKHAHPVTGKIEEFLRLTGRAERTIKIGGEKVSLNAIERHCDELHPRESFPGLEGPTHLVEASGDDGIVTLFTVRKDLDVTTVNSTLGLSSVFQIRQIKVVDRIQELGAGKTDYKVYRALLKKEVM